MDLALETLVYGLNEMRASNEGRVLFVNARAHGALGGEIEAVQWFKPYYDEISKFANYTSGVASRRVKQYSRIEEVFADHGGDYDAAYLLFPKNMVEGRYFIAQASRLVKASGMIYVSAENKAGGSRLQKIVQQFGGEIVQQISKHKSRFVAFENMALDQSVVDGAIKEGSLKVIDKTGFEAQSGVYGYNKIDKGSAVLLRHIPQDLKGKVADFGCGYGYLLQHLLQQNEGIKIAYGIDADARALECARQNLLKSSSCDLIAGSQDEQEDPSVKPKDDGCEVEFLWADLLTADGVPARLDAIIMNPPFHEGKKADSDIGVSFIKTAAASLRRNGALYMVANNQLPYEAVLKDAFFSYECLAQDNGFKVFKAVV